ncbi:transcription cofactor vestigial-like protein 4 isoform X2 [Pectinophora gossypiella]|uniref:transcription cofactor vestigial-like protein 4 isoform X2 n=1 Tax=Pectinophora gossypiella TaxID=13191 RepID=UPI00214F35BD|nr:transcription cofactor vestigial-like protein 4 isoform X2 [Pectinophora gossypiella]XP_049866547.1 transcription cofactor vestigial-like protein 4 isoform X2 [Pectinophora gossypiella]
MEKVETPLDVLSRAATMVQPCPAYPASDSDSFESPSTASSGESEGDRTLSPEAPRAQPKELTGKWRRERRSARLPDYRPRENGKMALRSQSFNERRSVAAVARAQPHSDGDLSDEVDEAANLAINGKGAPPEYPGKHEAPIDMRLRSRPAPPPYTRPSVITKSNDAPPSSMSMCDPVIDEHFRRSLGDDYMNLFKKNNAESQDAQPGPKPNTKDRASSPIQFKNEEPPKPTKIIAMDVDDANLSVDDHFAKALGDTWRQIQTSRLKETQKTDKTNGGVDDHFSKALGDTWKKIQSSKFEEDKSKEQTTKIISRSGVVI